MHNVFRTSQYKSGMVVWSDQFKPKLTTNNKMYNHVIVILSVLSITSVWCSPQFTHLLHKREVFCGRKLSDALTVICGGVYNSPSRGKKSMSDFGTYDDYEELSVGGNDQDNQLDFGFMSKEAANSLLPLRQRKGIVDECCHKPCTYKHLSLYCQ